MKYWLTGVVKSPLATSFAPDWIPFQKYVLGMLGIYKAVFAVETISGAQWPVLCEGQFNDHFWLPDFKLKKKKIFL